MYILYTVRHSDAAMTVFKFLINYIDVDECGVNNGGCDHDCVKTTAGAQECQCNPGYVLHTDGKRCLHEFSKENFL